MQSVFFWVGAHRILLQSKHVALALQPCLLRKGREEKTCDSNMPKDVARAVYSIVVKVLCAVSLNRMGGRI